MLNRRAFGPGAVISAGADASGDPLIAVTRGTMKSRKYEQPRRKDIHVAPAKKAERQHARPGAGIKRARAVMSKKPRSS
jgi:hypothetical protein